MPAIFGVLSRVMKEASYRLDISPKTMLDFGTGPGTAVWCVHLKADQGH